MQNQNDQNERVRPKIESAADLKGGKARPKAKKSIGRKRALTAVSLVLALGLVIGAYFLTDMLKPAEETPEETASATETVTLIDRERTDLDRLTIYVGGKETYTIVSNLKQKADAEAAAQEAEAAAQATEAPQEASVADAVKESLDNVLGVMDVGGNLDSASDEAAPQPTALPTPEELASAVGTDDAALSAEPTPAPEEAQKELPDYEIEGMPWFEVNASVAKSPAVYSYAFTASKKIEEASEDLSQYGLAEPQVRVVFRYHDGTETTLNIGDKVVAGNYYYVTLDDSHDVYMAYKNVYTYYTYDLAALHVVPTLETVDSENIRDLTIAQRGKETVQMKYLDDGAENLSVTLLKLVQPFAYDTNSDRATEVIEASAALAITAYAGYAPDEASLAAFGLTEPYASVSIADANGVSLSFTIGDYVAGGETYRYVTVDDSGNVYTMDASLLSYLSNVRASYVVDQFSNLVYINRITGFELAANGTAYAASIEREPYIDDNGKEQNKETFFYEGEETSEDLFKDFYQVLIGTLFDKRMEDEKDYRFEGDVYASVTYHLTYTDEPFVVEYLDYDRDYYAIRRDGLTLFLIRKDKITNLVATAEQYRNGEFVGDTEG